MREDSPPLLMTPGPTRIPDEILLAGHRVLHHRTPEFSLCLGELLELMRPLFGAASADILPVHATGRAAMEGAILNVRINIAGVEDKDFVGKLTSEYESYKARGEALVTDILRTVDQKIMNA